MRRKSNYFRKQSGASLVEAAVALPVIMIILMGTLQWGLIFGNQLVMTHAASVGARIYSADPTTYSDPQDVIATTENALTPFVNQDDVVVQVSPVTVNGQTLQRITCTYVMNLITPFVVPNNVNGTLTLTAYATARKAAS